MKAEDERAAKALKQKGKDARRAYDLAWAEELRKQRVALGLTQAEVSAQVGVSQQQYAKYESGENRMSVGTLQWIVERAGVQITNRFALTEQEEITPAEYKWRLRFHQAFKAYLETLKP